MAYDIHLAGRMTSLLEAWPDIETKKMFGGLCYFLHGNMLIGVWKQFLIVRLGPEQAEAALREPHVRLMDITGKPMTGWVMVEPQGYTSDEKLHEWIQCAVQFVRELPRKSSKAKKSPPRPSGKRSGQTKRPPK